MKSDSVTYGRSYGTLFVVMLLVLFVAIPMQAQTGAPATVQLDPGSLAKVQKSVQAKGKEYRDAYKKLVRDADKEMVSGPWSVTKKQQVPPSGDRHDYMSLAPYYWPDPSKPGGLPYMQRDGQRNPEADSITDNEDFDRMVKATYTLALAYYFAGEDRYGERAALLLRTWFLDPEQRMNPNLNFGQMQKGKAEKGRPSGLIEMRGLVKVIDAAALIEGCSAWSADDMKGLKRWFEEYYTWLMESEIGKKEYATTNNHGVWANVQAAAIALFTGKTQLAAKHVDQAKTSRIAVQITPEGKQPRELARTKSLHYTMFNLEAFFTLAMVGSRVGVDLWNFETGDGRSIRKALDWALPYITGEKKWEYEQIDEAKTNRCYPILLQASSVYGDEKYRVAAETVGGDDAKKDRSNLLFIAH